MEVNLICKKCLQIKLRKNKQCRNHRNYNNWVIFLSSLIAEQFCIPHLPVLLTVFTSRRLIRLIFFMYFFVCVCARVCSGLNICASLLLCNWTNVGEQETRNTGLIAFSIPPSRLVWLFAPLFGHQSCNKDRKHILSVKKTGRNGNCWREIITSWWSAIKTAAGTTTGCTVT